MANADTMVQEIVTLHHFFEDWFNARLPNTTAAFAHFADAMGDAFQIITPGGRRLDRAAIVDAVRAGYGQQMGLQIEVRNVAVLWHGAAVMFARYEEWQRASVSAAWRGRVSTVLMTWAEGRWQWQHVHETWLPEVSE